MNIMSRIFPLLLMLLLMSCDDSTEKTATQRPENVSPAVHHSKASDVTIYPDGARANTIITLKKDSSPIYGSEVHWYINDIKDESSIGIKFHSEKLNKGDIVKAVIIADGKEDTSNEITIKNTPPSLVTAKLLPSRPKLDAMFSVEVSARDVDDDHISFIYRYSHEDNISTQTRNTAMIRILHICRWKI